MKNKYKNKELNDKIKVSVNGKKSVNLKDDHGLYFQIGLVIVLVLVLFGLEYKTENPRIKSQPPINVSMNDFIEYNPVVMREEKKPEPIKKALVSENLPPEVAPDSKEIIDTDVLFEPTSTAPTQLSTDDIARAPEKEEIEEFNLDNVEFVPVYPGCEGLKTNGERKACLEEHLKTLITKNFDTNAVEPYATSGINRISVQFTVDQNGVVTDIKTRAAHPKLEQEASRVLHKVPQMKPGSKAGKKVKVIYAQPILFKLEN